MMAKWRILEIKNKLLVRKTEAEPTVKGRNYQANRSLKAAHFTTCDGKKNRSRDTEKYVTIKCLVDGGWLRNTGTFAHY